MKVEKMKLDLLDIIEVAFLHILFATYGILLIFYREPFLYVGFMFLFIITTIQTRKVYKKYKQQSKN